MALTKVSRGLLSTGIVDNSNATAITINADESVTLAGALTGTSAAFTDVVSVSNANSRLRLFETDTTNLNTQLQSQGGDFKISTLTDDSSSATLRLLIDHASGGVGIGGSTITDSNLLNIQGSSASVNIGVVFNDTNTSKIFGIQNGGSSLKFFDYTANAERMRLSGGSLLVGKTALDNSSVGIRLNATGDASFVANGNRSLVLNRKTSDGDVALFLKDGTTVGSIGTLSGTMYIGNGDCNLLLTGATDQMLPVGANAATKSGQIDLGSAGNQFKDLYLSSGVFLGGTGAANKQDDFEFGSWTPAISYTGGGTGISHSNQSGYYTKIGNRVFLQCYVRLNALGSSTGDVLLGGFPYAQNATSPFYSPPVVWYNNMILGTDYNLEPYGSPGSTFIRMYRIRGQDATGSALPHNALASSTDFMMSFNYAI